MLSFPFETPPEPGKTLEIAEGILWLRMPLPMELDHINLYLLEDEAGWYIVDTGLGLDDTKKYWQEIFDNSLKGKPVIGVICTHNHFDHAGSAGWLCDYWECDFYMTEIEFFHAKSVLAPMGEFLNWYTRKRFSSYGMSQEFIENLQPPPFDFNLFMGPMPQSFINITADTVFPINGNRWRVVIGSGHSPAHACLYCDELDVLLSGDQVIASITSNVGVDRHQPAGDTVRQWLESFPALMGLPNSALVCPAHKLPFYGLHERCSALIDHHYEQFDIIREACVEPRNASELVPLMFKRELEGFNFILGISETIAHLNYMVNRGELSKNQNEEGTILFTNI